MFLQKDTQDKSHHNVQIVDIITHKNKKYYILRDRDFFIKSILISNINYTIGIYLNIKEYYLEYQNGEFLLIIEKFINLGSLSDIPGDLKNINLKLNKEKTCKIYANWSYNALFFNNKKKLENNLLIDDVSADFCLEMGNIDNINLSFRDSDFNFLCCLDTTKSTHNNSFIKNDFTFNSESFSNIFGNEDVSTIEGKSDISKIEKDVSKIQKNVSTIEKDVSKIEGGDKILKIEKDVSKIEKDIFTIEGDQKNNLPFSFPIFSKVNFRHKKILSRKRGKYLANFENVRNLKNLFIKKNIYKYTEKSKIKYFNILPSQKVTPKKAEVDEYNFLNDTLFDKDYLL